MKRNEVLTPAASWLNLENVTLQERSQAEKDKYCLIRLICGTEIGKVIKTEIS